MTEAVTMPELISPADAAAVRDAALKLTPRDRATLAHELLESLGGVPESEFESTEPVQLSDEWMTEIQWRVEDFKSGKTVPIDGDMVRQEARRRVGL